jgi:aminomethyltransferase
MASAIFGQIFNEGLILTPTYFANVIYEGEPIVLSATGYTGSGGFEIYAPNEIIVKLWDRILLEGKSHGIAPRGLSARDTLYEVFREGESEWQSVIWNFIADIK